jgi:hypothetical protein
MKEDSLFFLFVFNVSTKLDASDCFLGCFGKLLKRRGAWLGFMAFQLAMQKFLNIE